MIASRRISDIANRALDRVNIKVVRARPILWDRSFQRWVEEAEAKGVDPNDLGDDEWATDLLDQALATYYEPLVTPDSTVLELGPGTGRLTRHLIGKCREMILVDQSPVVCSYLERYLPGKGRFRVHRIEGQRMPMVATGSVDVVLAHGVVEHLDYDVFFWFLEEFARVLRPGGTIAFNFDDLCSDEGVEWLRSYRETRPDHRFRPHHPEMVRRLLEVSGFDDIAITATGTRIGFAVAHRADSGPPSASVG